MCFELPGAEFAVLLGRSLRPVGLRMRLFMLGHVARAPVRA
jgi:hypothetical protein